MKQLIQISRLYFNVLFIVLIASCNNRNSTPSAEVIKELNLKRGDIISCGPPDAQFGSVDFDMTCNKKAKKILTLQ